MKMAWPCPGFMLVRHIAQVILDDLEAFLGKRRPEEEGVGVIEIGGGSKAESENLPAEGGELSSVLGT